MAGQQKKTRWTRQFDLTTVPDDVLLAESARRLRARQVVAPRPKVLRQCPTCLQAYGARELRKHLPRCKGNAQLRPASNPRRVVRKVTDVEAQDAENYHYWQSIPVGERLAAVCELTEAAYSLKKAD